MFDKETGTSFTDLLFNILVGIVMLFFMSLLLVKIENVKHEDVKALTKYMVIVTWDPESTDDVDLYVQNPATDVPVCYYNLSNGLMYLDDDDLGPSKDIIVVDGVEREVKTNHEVIYIKDIIPGEYIINVHMYTKRNPGPTTVTVEIYGFDPYQLIEVRTIVLEFKGQETTIVRLTFNDEKKIVSRSYAYKRLTRNYISVGQ